MKRSEVLSAFIVAMVFMFSFWAIASSQALTWQMNQLKEKGLINSAMEGMKVSYSLEKEDAAIIRRYIDFIRR